MEKTTAQTVVTARSQRMENWGMSMKVILAWIDRECKGPQTSCPAKSYGDEPGGGKCPPVPPRYADFR
jgi:hypothetical protein